MKKSIYLLSFLMLIMLFSCCKTSKKGVADAHYSLLGTQWNLVALDGAKIGNEFALRPFITFDSTEHIQGNLGCNTFFGTYSVSKKQKMTLNFDGATKRLCPQMEVERDFIKALKRDISRYEIEGEELILYAGDDEVMRFTGVNLDQVE